MYKALKDNKIIAVNDSDNFSCLVYDEIKEDKEHNILDYVEVGGEFVLTSSDAAKKQAAAAEVEELKLKLAASDYAVIKIAEGAATAEDYAELIAQRQAWRARINELEGE